MLDGRRYLWELSEVVRRIGSVCCVDIHGSQNSLKLSFRREVMKRTISSADLRHSVWK